MVAVDIRGLTKRFGSTQVLKGVDLHVPDGAFAVLVGPSGCGKSTLLRLIAGLEDSDQGSICFGERDVTRAAPRERDIAMVFQSYALYPHLTVRKNLSFGLELKGAAKAEIDQRVSEVSAMLGLGPLLDRMPKELSGGQRQRVAMGRAIARRPALFLFDEPLSNLDAALRAQVRVDIRKQHDQLGATSVYVTHDQVEAMTLADRLFVLNQGQVEQWGSPLEIYSRPQTKFVAGFLGSPSMNFLSVSLAQLDGAWYARAAGVELALDAACLGQAQAGQRATLGIRPHALRVTDQARGLELQVDVVEALGSETFAHGSVGGEVVVARLDPGAQVSAGDRLRLSAAPELIHVFDPQTGRALQAPSG